TVVPFVLGESRGAQFMLGDSLLFSVLHGDLDPEHRQDFDALVRQTRDRIEGVRQAWHESRDRPLLLRGVFNTVLATLVLVLLVWFVARGGQRAVVSLEAARDRLAEQNTRVDWREFIARLAARTMQLVQWAVLLLLGYTWLRFVLGSFVATAPLSHQLSDWLLGKLDWVGEGVLAGLPGLMSIVIVLLVTRAIVDVLGYFFDAVQKGRMRVPLMHPETTTATRRIVTLITWGLGFAVAYPYLPGSNSDAFKGLSVLFGLMLTLGSTGLVTQAMSGLVVVYARALRKGDFVQINGVEGVVTEVASLATKIVNVRNEEITIPNSVLISSPIHNYSKLAGQQGTLVTTKVTIGYDSPWRQVHALLIEAARRTKGVRGEPAPFVYQRALSDFYVEYELYVSIDRAMERVPILSALHAHIQDMFNEAEVQIMSPHFLSQPDAAVIVPKSRWHTPAA
ncbi:MAG: mechanosensitive ion channel, partial [Burkholderiaceae bacterium]|nr:mechanosensitive ion channel [Burkholderiaceae bacterium]